MPAMPVARPWQRWVQRQAARAWASWILAHTLHFVDRPLLRLSRGRLCLTAWLTGLPVILLTTVGAKSGRQRTAPLVAVEAGDQLILVASYFGRRRHPSWYYNLRRQPEARVMIRGRSRRYLAREVDGPAYEAHWARAAEMYAGYAAYRARAAGRRVPVLELTPIEGGDGAPPNA